MRNKKGLTLIEVIVAIALVGIIAVGFIPAFASLFKITVDTKDITIESFDAQGALENAIHDLKVELRKDIPDFSGIDRLSTEEYSIFGWNVTMYKMIRDFPQNNNKDISVFLSRKLARMEAKQLLEATGVIIDVSSILPNPPITNETLADMSLNPNLTGLCDPNTDPNFLLNVYNWYVSKEGNPEPRFPEDFEPIGIAASPTPSELIDLSKVVNRYVLFTVTPVDIHGVRGNEVSSSNQVYILGIEWRAGQFAWNDINNTGSYDLGTDVELTKEQITTALNLGTGSLFVPMRIDPIGTDMVGLLNIDGTHVLDWTAENNINLATDITVGNSAGSSHDIKLTTRDGDIALYRYIMINNGVVAPYPNLINYGPTLTTLLGDILFKTEGQGDITLQNYSTLKAQKVELISHGSFKMLDGSITASDDIIIDASMGPGFPSGRDIFIDRSLIKLERTSTADKTIVLSSTDAIEVNNTTLSSNKSDDSVTINANDGITLINDIFQNMDVYLNDTTSMTGGRWSAGKQVSVMDGRTLRFQKGVSKVDNAGSLFLGDTGGVAFKNSMSVDLANPLKINLGSSAHDEVTIVTTYGRNVAYADLNTESITTAGKYQDLGSGPNNLEYTANKTAASIPGLSNLTYEFDGDNTITINATASGSVPSISANVRLTVRDKYANNAILASVNFSIDALGAGPASITVNPTIDSQAPVIHLLGDNPQVILLGDTYTELGATVSDNLDSGINPIIRANAVNTLVAGSYNVTYNAQDFDGNVAAEVIRTVNVVSSLDLSGALSFTVDGTPVTHVKTGTTVLITARFTKALQDIPIVRLAGNLASGTGTTNFAATRMAKPVDADQKTYIYTWNVQGGNGVPTFTFSDGIDLAGNLLTAAPTSAPITVDNTAPSAVITSNPVSPADANLINYTITFNEPVYGFNASDITVTNGTKGAFTGFGDSYSLDVSNTIVNSGTQTVGFLANVCTDLAGNGNTGPAMISVTIQIKTPLTGIGAISGTTQVGSTLTAGALTPAGATATYQWQSSSSAGGTYTNISGATSSTYTLVAGDAGRYLKVVATGSGNYKGSVTSAATTVITKIPITNIGAISGTTRVGSTLTAGALNPAGATATYQWQSSTSAGGTYTNISGATASTYTLVTGDFGRYIKVVATGSGSYTGSVTSGATSVVTRQLTAIAAITRVGNRTAGTLTAGALTPAGATATYQWQHSATNNGTYVNIAGATSATFTYSGGTYSGRYFKVVATGSGNNTGTVTSASFRNN